MTEAPRTQYARSGDVHIAYQVVGDGPLDLVMVWGTMSHIELFWQDPLTAAFLRRLASFSRLIMFDKRGCGLSDRVGRQPTLEERMDDVRAVMDAAGRRWTPSSSGAPACGGRARWSLCSRPPWPRTREPRR